MGGYDPSEESLTTCWEAFGTKVQVRILSCVEVNCTETFGLNQETWNPEVVLSPNDSKRSELTLRTTDALGEGTIRSTLVCDATSAWNYQTIEVAVIPWKQGV